MEERKIKHAGLYIRVSTDKQARDGDSLREQKETLEAYAKEKGYLIYGTYIDEGISGQKLQARDELGRLLDDVRNGKIDVICFTKLDRWFRNSRHYLNTQALLDEHNVSWIAVREAHYDTTTPAGRMMVNISMSFAEMEAQMDSERIRAVFRNKVKNGEIITGNPPVGYVNDGKKLVPSKSAHLIAEAFQMYVKEPNIHRLMLIMRDKGENHTHKKWKEILSDRIYLGQYRDNPAYCQPIISRELFDRVQVLVKRNCKQNKKDGRVYLFSGILICSECGLHYAGTQAFSRQKLADGSVVPYSYNAYRCQKHCYQKTCGNGKRMTEGAIEKYLLSELKPLMSLHYDAEVKASEKVADVESEIKTLQHKIDRLKDLYVNDLIDLETYKRDKDAYMASIASKMAQKPPERKDLSIYQEILKGDLKGIYDVLDAEHKRQFWQQIIKEIRIGKDGIEAVSFF